MYVGMYVSNDPEIIPLTGQLSGQSSVKSILQIPHPKSDLGVPLAASKAIFLEATIVVVHTASIEILVYASCIA